MGFHFLTWFIIIQVGDFGDTNSWPTPGEIATKDMQVGAPVKNGGWMGLTSNNPGIRK